MKNWEIQVIYQRQLREKIQKTRKQQVKHENEAKSCLENDSLHVRGILSTVSYARNNQCLSD